MKIISLEELKKLLEQLESTSLYGGYHRIYQEKKIKEAISAYDNYSILKYFWFKPKYHQLIKQARGKITI